MIVLLDRWCEQTESREWNKRFKSPNEWGENARAVCEFVGVKPFYDSKHPRCLAIFPFYVMEENKKYARKYLLQIALTYDGMLEYVPDGIKKPSWYIEEVSKKMNELYMALMVNGFFRKDY